MTDTNQGDDATGSTAVATSSRQGTGDGELKGEEQDHVGSRQDRPTPTSEASRNEGTDRIGTGTRRRFLAAVSAASAALAGCPGGSDAGETDTPISEPSETPTTTASETPTPEPAPTPTATPTPQPVNGVRIPGAAQTELGLGAVAFEEITIDDEGGE